MGCWGSIVIYRGSAFCYPAAEWTLVLLNNVLKSLHLQSLYSGVWFRHFNFLKYCSDTAKCCITASHHCWDSLVWMWTERKSANEQECTRGQVRSQKKKKVSRKKGTWEFVLRCFQCFISALMNAKLVCSKSSIAMLFLSPIDFIKLAVRYLSN